MSLMEVCACRAVYRARTVRLAAPRQVEPNAEHLSILSAMGFNEAAARHALVRNDNAMEAAINMLTTLPAGWVPEEGSAGEIDANAAQAAVAAVPAMDVPGDAAAATDTAPGEAVAAAGAVAAEAGPSAPVGTDDAALGEAAPGAEANEHSTSIPISAAAPTNNDHTTGASSMPAQGDADTVSDETSQVATEVPPARSTHDQAQAAQPQQQLEPAVAMTWAFPEGQGGGGAEDRSLRELAMLNPAIADAFNGNMDNLFNAFQRSLSEDSEGAAAMTGALPILSTGGGPHLNGLDDFRINDDMRWHDSMPGFIGDMLEGDDNDEDDEDDDDNDEDDDDNDDEDDEFGWTEEDGLDDYDEEDDLEDGDLNGSENNDNESRDGGHDRDTDVDGDSLPLPESEPLPEDEELPPEMTGGDVSGNEQSAAASQLRCFVAASPDGTEDGALHAVLAGEELEVEGSDPEAASASSVRAGFGVPGLAGEAAVDDLDAGSGRTQP
jgi:hypothetical protein